MSAFQRGRPSRGAGRLVAALLALCVVSPISAAAQAPRPPAEVTPEQVERALRAYAHEPSLAELVEAARQAPGLDDASLRRLRRRMRRAALLPVLVVRGRRGRTEDLDEDLNLQVDDDLSGDLELRWQLEHLVASDDELAILREERARARDREGRIRLVIVAYYERRRLQLERDLSGQADLHGEVRILELASLLDALTGGAFSRGDDS